MVPYYYNLEYIYKTKFVGKLPGPKPNPFTEFRKMNDIRFPNKMTLDISNI